MLLPPPPATAAATAAVPATRDRPPRSSWSITPTRTILVDSETLSQLDEEQGLSRSGYEWKGLNRDPPPPPGRGLSRSPCTTCSTSSSTTRPSSRRRQRPSPASRPASRASGPAGATPAASSSPSQGSSCMEVLDRRRHRVDSPRPGLPGPPARGGEGPGPVRRGGGRRRRRGRGHAPTARRGRRHDVHRRRSGGRGGCGCRRHGRQGQEEARRCQEAQEEEGLRRRRLIAGRGRREYRSRRCCCCCRRFFSWFQYPKERPTGGGTDQALRDIRTGVWWSRLTNSLDAERWILRCLGRLCVRSWRHNIPAAGFGGNLFEHKRRPTVGPI
mmetsp:Transcript_8677/g.24388  ORF Transcript_8677/g.24388 Transcript_8677/m.24388 type:complete len:329 (-) Transcript_8677:500-1486(-)